MRCVVDGPRLEAFKERLPKKQTTLHRRNATRNFLDNYIADPWRRRTVKPFEH